MRTRLSRTDYGRIVSERHFERLTGAVDHDRVVTGGRSDASRRYLEPTVVEVDDPDHPEQLVMRDEIFGPVLPLVEVDDLDAAIAFVNGGRSRWRSTSSPPPTGCGSASCATPPQVRSAFNVPLAHLAVPGLPFGGVGASGTGAYHGEHSVELFSHAKSVLSMPTRPDTTVWVRPPFTALKQQVIARVAVPGRRRRSPTPPLG